jgi:glycine C-acetyltransferase
VVNSTLGKALGGGNGGYTAGKKEVIEVLRNKGRTYLFSNSVSPSIVGASCEVFKMLNESTALLDNLRVNTKAFRIGMKAAGFNIMGHDDSPIVPVLLGCAKIGGLFAEELMKEGIYVISFSYPVVPLGAARIRC